MKRQYHSVVFDTASREIRSELAKTFRCWKKSFNSSFGMRSVHMLAISIGFNRGYDAGINKATELVKNEAANFV